MIKNKVISFVKKHPEFKRIYLTVNKIFDDDIFGLSAELTFYLTASFFPFVILLLALVSVTPLSAEETLFPLLSNLPGEVYDIVLYVLTGIKRSIVIVCVSSVIALWSVSSAASTISKALNRMYKASESRNFLVIRSIGFIFAILFAITMILTFVLIVLGNLIGGAIMEYAPSFYKIWHMLRILIPYLVVLIAFATIYKILPNKKLKYKDVALGAIFTTILWAISSLIFSFYVDNFSNYHIIYGSLTGIIVLMTWLYMSSFILLLGGEVNSILHYLKIKNTARK